MAEKDDTVCGLVGAAVGVGAAIQTAASLLELEDGLVATPGLGFLLGVIDGVVAAGVGVAAGYLGYKACKGAEGEEPGEPTSIIVGFSLMGLGVGISVAGAIGHMNVRKGEDQPEWHLTIPIGLAVSSAGFLSFLAPQRRKQH